MNQHEELARGQQARTLLDDPLFNEAFDTLEAGIVGALLDLPIEADDKRLRLACMHKAAQEVRKILASYVAGADIVRAQILQEEQQRGLMERIKERVRRG